MIEENCIVKAKRASNLRHVQPRVPEQGLGFAGQPVNNVPGCCFAGRQLQGTVQVIDVNT